MGGPIRPTLGYVAKLIKSIKIALHNFNVVTHLVTWTTDLDDEKYEILNCIFDHTYYYAEPTDNEIKTKDIQTIQMRTHYFTDLNAKFSFIAGYYKLYFAYRQLVNSCKIPDDDIVIRIRTDLYIDPKGYELINRIIDEYKKNIIYIRPNRCASWLSDWFAISDYSTFKKTYYIPNDDKMRFISEQVFNSEEVIIYNAKQNKVDVAFIDASIVNLQLCREFKNGIEKLHSLD